MGVDNGHVFFGSGTVLMAADASDATNPRIVGEETLPGFISDLTISDGFAYVAASKAGLRIVDISDPTAPRETGYVDDLEIAEGVAVSGACVCVACYTNITSSLRLIDVTDPSSPVETGHVDFFSLVSSLYML